MNTVNKIFNGLFDLIFSPFRNSDPVWGLLVVSVLTGIAMLYIFKATSDQAGIKRAKNRVKAHFLAIRLYRDDIGLMFDTMKNIVMSNLFYLRESVRPMLFLILPVALILIHLGSRYEYRPLQAGESTVLTIRLAETASLERLDEVELRLPAGLKLAAPPVRIPSRGEISWRILAERTGHYEIAFALDDEVMKKKLEVVDGLVTTATEIARNSITTTLMNPAESPVPSSSQFTSISIGYPKRELSLAGFDVHWLVAFLIFSLVAAFSLKGLLGIEV